MIRVVRPGSSPDFLPIPDLGSRCQKGTRSRTFDPDPQYRNAITLPLLLGLRGEHRLRDPLHGGREDCGLQLAGAVARHLDSAHCASYYVTRAGGLLATCILNVILVTYLLAKSSPMVLVGPLRGHLLRVAPNFLYVSLSPNR
jgi:hypothetical protein